MPGAWGACGPGAVAVRGVSHWLANHHACLQGDNISAPLVAVPLLRTGAPRAMAEAAAADELGLALWNVAGSGHVTEVARLLDAGAPMWWSNPEKASDEHGALVPGGKGSAAIPTSRPTAVCEQVGIWRVAGIAGWSDGAAPRR